MQLHNNGIMCHKYRMLGLYIKGFTQIQKPERLPLEVTANPERRGEETCPLSPWLLDTSMPCFIRSLSLDCPTAWFSRCSTHPWSTQTHVLLGGLS